MNSFAALIVAMEKVFDRPCCFDQRRVEIEKLLDVLDLQSSEVDRYAFWDEGKDYTRNLIHADGDFSLLLLCWAPGRESKIHNHPCQGCFSKIASI